MLEWLGNIFLTVGVLFFLGTVVSVLRFPDFYTRMHGASKGDTLSTLMLLSGIICHLLAHDPAHNGLLSFKILLITLFLFIASPGASHALIDAAFSAKVSPWVNPRWEEEKNDE